MYIITETTPTRKLRAHQKNYFSIARTCKVPQYDKFRERLYSKDTSEIRTPLLLETLLMILIYSLYHYHNEYHKQSGGGYEYSCMRKDQC